VKLLPLRFDIIL